MRSYGEINGIDFKKFGYDIYNLAYKFELRGYQGKKFVYVNSMAELREEINKFNGEHYEED
jgi:hypothetical protein